MKRRFSKLLSALLALAMLLTLLPTAAFAAGETGTYSKVTEDQDDWTGEYLLVYEGGTTSYVFDGSLSKLDAVNNYVEISADGDSITTQRDYAITVEAVEGGYVIKAANGSYIYSPSESNTLTTSPNQETAAKYPITFSVESDGIDIALSSGPHMRFNANGGQMRFRYYKSSTYTGQQPVTLYKLDGEGSTTDPGEDPDPQPSESPIKDGDSVVFYLPAKNQVMTTTSSGSKLAGQEATLENGTLNTDKTAAVFTVGTNDEGQFTFSADGKYLTSGETGNSLTMTEAASEYSCWTLEEQGDGWLVKNASAQHEGKAQYIEYYNSNFTTYGYNSSDSGIYTIQFFQADEVQEPGGTTEPEGAELVETPADGDIVVIYYPTGEKIMGTESYTYTSSSGSTKDELVALDGSLSEGLLTVPEGAAEFKVHVDENGHYTFQSDSGYLYLDGTHVRLVEEQGDYTLFDLEKRDSGSFIKSTNAAHNEKPQYLEYYGGYFTCYGMGSNPDIYTFQFYKTGTFDAGEDPEPEPSDGPIADGDQVVIYNPAYGKALSGAYSGYYNIGTDVTLGSDGTLTGFTAADVWTVIDNGDGTWSFSYEGQNIGMGDSFSSMPLGEKNDKWVLEDADNGLWYIKNTVRGCYMEWFVEKNNWSSYYNITSSSENMFALAFYEVTEMPEPPSGEVEFPDGPFVIYNASSGQYGHEGVLGGQDDNVESPSITDVAATVQDGSAVPGNGARVFTVEETADGYYRFKTADGYLSSNGTGNNAFYQTEANEDADWKVSVYNGGYNLMSRTAKYNGYADQYLEYYGGSYKTYSLYDSQEGDDPDIYTFHFYPLADGVTVTDGVVNAPAVVFSALPDAYVGQDYTVTFTVDAVFGLNTISAKYGGTDAELTVENGVYSFTIPASALTAEGTLSVAVTGADTKGVTFTDTAQITVKDEPYIGEVFPAPGVQTGDDKRPVIGFTFGNAEENASITMSVNGAATTPVLDGNRATYTPGVDLADGKVTVSAAVTRTDGKTASRTWSFTIGTAQYQLYFGQLHSHTTYSDGSGSLESALDYVANLPESANVDFVSFTDHSNYFDASGNANPEAALYDPSQMTAESAEKWADYTGAVADFNAAHTGELVALAGFEMTWSGGPGHINTFNTEGLVSRNNTTLNSKTADAGMKAYYSLLSQSEGVDSISQFNHPGDTFGTFSDFAYWDPVIDTRIQLVEVGNGEGAIGAGGYYPSYEYYVMALDKGWHVAPTNNQDNHKGKWGNANDARDVILTDDFSEEGIYQAIRDRRIYATEDKNLEITYTLNGEMLGSTIEEVPETAEIAVSVYDPDSTDSIARVEVVVNSGVVAYAWDDPAELASGALACSIPASYSYYFIRVTQADGDIAVTAPVWVGETLKLGISSVECGTANPVTGEEVTITTNLFNSEAEDATVNSITYALKNGETLYTDTTGYTIPASGGTLAVDWGYVPTQARLTTITVTVTLTQGGSEYTYSMDVTLDVMDAERLVYIGIDASHYNEYVAGNYKDSMGNFGNLAASHLVRTVELKTREDLLAACANADGKYTALILTAPSRRDGSVLRDPYAVYSDAEIQAIADFNAAGGTVIVAGWSDYYESYADFPAEDHMAAQQNKLLAALGSSLRIGDDATNDDSLNGGQTQRLYFNTYNWDSFLVDGVEYDAEHDYDNMYTQLFSQYGGASVYVVDETGSAATQVPDTVTPVVYGHATTYSKDSDGDGLGGSGMPKYAVAEGDDRLMVLATEQLEGKGLIVVSGAAFMSNFEVQAEVEDSGAEKNYSNYNICENLVEYLNPTEISPIADVQAQTLEGVRYTIEGVVTSNASGYDQATAFFDCIYLQDESAGINAFPVSGSYKIGDVVRITGTTSSYQGERQIAVTSIEKIGETSAPTPKVITAAELNDGSVLGSLVTLKGTVVSFEAANGLIQTILVRDEAGNVGRVFIDGYITTDKDVEDLAVGCSITATGLASYDNTFNAPEGPFPRIRVRDRADIVCTAAPSVDPGSGSEDGYDDDRTAPRPGQDDTDIPDSDTPLSAGVFTDLDSGAWYYDAVSDVVDQGLMKGVSGTSFAPDQQVSRSMLATVLYRMSGETWEGSQAGFPDVEPNTWYSDAVDWANAAGVIKGYDTGLFGVNDNITREQLVTMLYRYWLHLGGDASVQTDLTAFADAGTVSKYAREAMAWAVAQGLIQGRPGNLLAPAEGATRAELCTILVRFQALER